MQPLEHSEELLRMLHGKPGTVIADEVHALTVLGPRTDVDYCWVALSRVLQRVRKQVCEDLLEERAIGLTGRQVGDGNLHVPAFLFRLQLLEPAFYDRGRQD